MKTILVTVTILFLAGCQVGGGSFATASINNIRTNGSGSQSSLRGNSTPSISGVWSGDARNSLGSNQKLTLRISLAQSNQIQVAQDGTVFGIISWSENGTGSFDGKIAHYTLQSGAVQCTATLISQDQIKQECFGHGTSSNGILTREQSFAENTTGEADRATDDEIGKNQGKGGNPDWMYDDVDHSKCFSVKPSFQNSGSRMAYGHYKLINNCAYPIKARTCITTDLMEGSSNYDLHQDGAKCPGMGWMLSELEANEVEEGREWFEYSRIKWDVQVCRKDWSFVGSDGESYPSNILGEKYGCRIRQQ